MAHEKSPASIADPIDELVRDAVERYREKLLDLSNRNPLINFRHSDRSRSHVRLVNEIPEIVFTKLSGGRQLAFVAVPDPVSSSPDEQLPFFVTALEKAKREDQEYRKELAELGPNPSQRQKQRIDRGLRDRVRDTLGLPQFRPAKDARGRAAELGMDTSYDLPTYEGQGARRFTDLKLQTLFFRQDLDRKLSGLRNAARVLSQDAGLSALYCAFGFLEYYESEASEEARLAPLVFYPIEIDRVLDEGEYIYFVRPRNDDIETNVALAELLRQQFSMELPGWVEIEEAEGNALENYFARIKKLISNRPDWKLRRYATVGLFTFSTLVMYKDIDPEEWSRVAPIEKHELIRTLVAGAERDPSTFEEDYAIDENPKAEVLLITDADSSQHSAVIDVLQGKNCVIQGPPGTGKSQTITNVIAAAMNAGKSILFVAEKMAALEVVKKRLDSAGLQHFCLEVHSAKTARNSVIGSIGKRLEYRPPRLVQEDIKSNLEALGRARKELVQYVQKLNQTAGSTGLRVCDVLNACALRDQHRHELPTPVANARLASALSITRHQREELLDAAANLEKQAEPLRAFGTLAEHPWRGFGNCEITGLDFDRLLSELRTWLAALEDVYKTSAELGEHVKTHPPQTTAGLLELCRGIDALPRPPAEFDANLFSRLGTDDSRQRLSDVNEALLSLLEAEQKLAAWCKTGVSAVTRIGSARLESAYGVLVDLGLLNKESASNRFRKELGGLAAVVPDRLIEPEKVTIESLRETLAKWRAICADIERAIPHAQKLTRMFSLDDTRTEAIRAVSTGIDLLGNLPRDLLLMRDAEILDERNTGILKEGSTRCSRLVSIRAELSVQFDLSLLPSQRDLKVFASALRAANFVTVLFSRDCWRAKKLMRVASKTRRDLDRHQLADELLKCAEFLESVENLLDDKELKRVCGSRFRGLNTLFAVLVELNGWGRDVCQRLSAYGPVGQAVRQKLFTAEIATLDAALAVAKATEHEALERVLTTFRDESQPSLNELLQRETGRTTQLAGAVATLEESGLAGEVAILDLPTIVHTLSEIEGRIRAIDSDVAVHDLLDQSADESKAQTVVITNALRHATKVSSSQLAPEMQTYIFKSIANQEKLKQHSERLNEKINVLRTATESVESLANLDAKLWCGQETFEDASLPILIGRCKKALDSADAFQTYINFLLAEDAAIDCGVGPVLRAFDHAGADYKGLATAAELVFYYSAAEEILNSDPWLKRHTGSNHESLRKHYQNLDREHLLLLRKQLALALSQRSVPAGTSVGRVREYTELGLLQHVADQTRPQVSVRELFRRAGNAIQALKPCWMMSPMSVAQFLAPGALKFDLVIMDEASQIRPEEALGAIARAKQLVVVGDQKQLPPTPFFQKLASDGSVDEEAEDVDVRQESILEAAASRFHPKRRLKWHYRSEHGSLISFSNREFYDNHLIVFPSPHHDEAEYGVKCEYVGGAYGSSINLAEVRAIVRAAADFMARHVGRSLGIVAVNSPQADLIREEMDSLFASDPSAEAYRLKWENELESFFVKNLENVQGDERDVIFISTVYGKDEAGSFHQRFGPINSIYGHRRLNVLFTRAKKMVKVFTSMMPSDILDEGKRDGVGILKRYLQYAAGGHSIPPRGLVESAENEFEQWVMDVLRAEGFQCVPQLEFSGYRIDIAVRHPNKPGTFVCGVECDGATYHSARSVRERDRLRQEILERYGWNIYRIWSTDWFRNPKLQTSRLVNHLRGLC